MIKTRRSALDRAIEDPKTAHKLRQYYLEVDIASRTMKTPFGVTYFREGMTKQECTTAINQVLKMIEVEIDSNARMTHYTPALL